MRAVEIRRKVTAEILKGAMRKGKFGITYTDNLVGKVPAFVDYVMIEAAAMKRSPEFMESSFNVRAKAVVEDSNFVPLIRSERRPIATYFPVLVLQLLLTCLLCLNMCRYVLHLETFF